LSRSSRGCSASPQLRELFLLAAGQAVTTAILLSIGQAHPVPQARIADAKILGNLGNRRGALAGELDGTLPELQGVWRGHGGHPSW
jgi:hypothetical protein